MHEIMKPKEHHSGIIFSIVLVLMLMMASGFYLIYLGKSSTIEEAPKSSIVQTVDKIVGDTKLETETTEGGFEVLEEDETTPVEIDNEAVEELDAIIEYIDNNVETDDFTDLDL